MLLGGATVMIVDGVNQGLFNTTNEMGHYSISSLKQDSFFVSVSAWGHATVSRTIVPSTRVFNGSEYSYANANKRGP